MKSQKKADRAAAERAARLIVELTERPTKRAWNATFRWANRSPTHMREILQTLSTVEALENLRNFAADYADRERSRGGTLQ
jgi:ferric-dicitrate binding protein FerR (iron transport regulator)